MTVQGSKARHKSQAKISPNPYLLSCHFLVTMSSPVTNHKFLTELPALSHNTNATFWIPLCPAIPEWVPYRIIPQNIQVPPKHNCLKIAGHFTSCAHYMGWRNSKLKGPTSMLTLRMGGCWRSIEQIWQSGGRSRPPFAKCSCDCPML